jgi:hypothetical protein
MFLGRKAVDTSTKSVLVASLLQACFEVMDRAAEIETLLRNNCFPLLNSDDLEGGQATEGREMFLREETRLRSLRRELLGAELRVDASLRKIAAICGSEREHLEPLDGYFLTKLDRAISNHRDAIDPHSSEATRDLTSNYLIKEEQFPFGDLFDEREVRVFFGKMRNAMGHLIRELAE